LLKDIAVKIILKISFDRFSTCCFSTRIKVDKDGKYLAISKLFQFVNSGYSSTAAVN